MTPDARHSAYLEAVGRDLEVAARRHARVRLRRRTQMRVAALSMSAVILLTGSSLAASTLLGVPAPGIVQATIDSLWPRGDTHDLAPMPGTARVVAESENATLYQQRARGSDAVCVSIVLAKERVTSCVRRIPSDNWTVPPDSHVMGGRQLVLGQIRNRAGTTLVVQWQGGEAIRVPIGTDGFFLGELPLAKPRPAGATPGMATVRIVDGDGFVVAHRDFARFSAGSVARQDSAGATR